jgi:hypothetical protein
MRFKFNLSALVLGFLAACGMFGMHMIDLSEASISDLDRYAVVNGSDLEALRQPIYDYQLYPTAGQGQLQFFQQQYGAGMTSALGAVVAATKNLADTNMTMAGQLSKGINLLLESVEVSFEPGRVATANTYLNQTITTVIAVPTTALTSGPNDVDIIRQSGWLDFVVLSKNYLRYAPLGMFPMMTALNLDAALASNSATTLGLSALSARAAGRPFFLNPLVTIPSNMNFSFNLNWPGAVATPSGFNGRIGVSLDGVQFRSTQ